MEQTPIGLSVFTLILGFLFVAGTFLIGKKNEKKGIAITFSIVNILIAIAAFLPVRRYRIPLRTLYFMFRQNTATGLMCALPFVFIALIGVFALLTMISAVKKNRKQPRGLCIAILITACVYALVSIVSLLFANPHAVFRVRFSGLYYVVRPLQMIFRGNFRPELLLNPFSSTAHYLFPFATIAVFFAMFFAAKSIQPIEAAEKAEAPAFTAAPSYSAQSAPAGVQYSGKSKVAAAILAGAIGNLGVHRFYLGRAGSAVVQLLGGISLIAGYVATIIESFAYRSDIAVLVIGLVLLLFGCGTGIWALVDFIRILCNKLKPASGEFGNPPQNTAAPAFQPAYAAPKQEAAPQFVPAEPKFTEVQPEPAAEVNKIDRIERELNKLNDMRERGLISVDEYYALRKDILGL